MFKLAGISEVVAMVGAGLIAIGWLPLQIIGGLIAVPAVLATILFSVLGWIDAASERTSRSGARDRRAEKAARERAAYRRRAAAREHARGLAD